MNNQDYKILKEDLNTLKIDKDLIEIQKTIIYYCDNILKELKEIKVLLKEEQKDPIIKNLDDPILRHLKAMRIPDGYGGNNLKR